MRLVVLLLAILLLPLRGWLGDAMALEAGPPHRMAISAGHDMTGMTGMDEMATPTAMTAMTAVAAMTTPPHAAPTAGDTRDGTTAAPDCPDTCTTCQLCHSVALTIWPDAPAPGEAPRQLPAFRPAAFASAAPAPGFKPPIY